MITEFTGEYSFLSNFWPALVKHEGTVFASVEHAYQAAKCKKEDWPKFQGIGPGAAKRLGRKLQTYDPGWEGRKLKLMHSLILQKFRNDAHLKVRLLDTGNQELIEGNTWGDTFWGVCGGAGKNHLGRILMEVRTSLSKESD